MLGAQVRLLEHAQEAVTRLAAAYPLMIISHGGNGNEADWYGRGAAPKILRALRRLGYQPIAKPLGFFVGGHPILPKTDGTLRDGEAERARQWGVELARSIE